MSGAGLGETIERLRSRRGEIEAALRTRVYAIGDPGETSDPAYSEGLRLALSAALDYGLEALAGSEEQPPPVPVALIAQARLAGRNRIGIDTVLRRYLAGHTLLGEFVVQEAAHLGVRGAALERLMRVQAAALDRLLAAVSEEYEREVRPSPASSERHRLRLVQRLLAGEPVDFVALRYPFEAQHVGLICLGPRAERVVREIAEAVDASLLTLRPNPDTVWAWLGAARRPDAAELGRLAAAKAPEGVAIALGESAEGLAGWRLTHRQAATALPIALRSEERVARYIDVALLASALNDDVLATTLKRLYLDPLERHRDGGKAARQTLRAYFDADRNVSSTAAILGMSRNTVGSRLRSVEAVLGRPLSTCAAELELALGLERLNPR